MTVQLPAVMAGRYELLEELGVGGSNQVFRARHRLSGVEVAVKLPRFDRTFDDEAETRLLHEAMLLRQIDSPYVAAYYGCHLWPSPYLTMQLVPGQPIRDLRGQQPASVIASIGQQACAGLSAIHAQGIVHRDVSPNNIIRGRVAKIIDLSIADYIGERQRLAQLDETGVVRGTAPYFSPEQVRGEQIDHRSDLFSLGSVLYKLAAGVTPFESKDPIQSALLVMNHDVPLEEHRDDLGLLTNAIHRAMAKNPDKRFQSAAEMATALATVPLPRPAYD
jgi:serine/threonine protein kinase